MSLIFMLFLLNLCYCLSSILVPMPYDMTQYQGQAMPGTDYGLNLDDYDMSVIYYNTVTM